MSLFDKLRFAFDPAGAFKEGKLYSWFPSETKAQFDASAFDVVRPTSVDRINKDGQVESVPPNVPVLDYSDGGCPKLLTGADDSITGAGDSSTFNSESGVLFADVKALSDVSNDALSINDGSSSNRCTISLRSDGFIQGFVASEGVSQCDIRTMYPKIIQNKISLKYQSNRFDLWINGINFGNDTSGGSPNNLSRIDLSEYSGSSNKLQAKTKSVQHFDALTDAELEELTGYDSYDQMVSQFNFTTL